ncbi:putative cytochrome P450 [Triangularia setosa]|uniref:Cytochrome P450 n=1 Tax=Triangularia setosa TaxID=2587417 RepID=A0AAN7A1Z0_9PEZI|nr:putative cytochrome P450 [Podospora setosa]
MDLLLNKPIPLSWPLVFQALLILLTVIIQHRFLHPLHTIPGPPLASVSHLWHIYHAIKGDQNLQLVSIHKKQGQFIRLTHNEVSVSHPDAVKKILGAPLKKGPWYRMTAIPDYRFQRPMAITAPKEKMEKSKAFASGTQLDSVISLLLSHLEVHLDKYFTFTSFDIAGEIHFSSQFGFLEKGTDIGNAIAKRYWLSILAFAMAFFYHVHVALLGNPFTTWLNILPYGHLLIPHKRDDSWFDSVGHCWRDLQAVAVSTVGAASETISCALQSFVYHMICSPGAWERVRREVLELQGTEGGAEKRVVSWAQAKRLAYLQACLKKGLRMFAPVPMNLSKVIGDMR